MQDRGWVSQSPEMIHQYVTPKSFLGEEDANDEWARERKPVDIFLHTSSYETFKRKDCLYMFGRRGTGKTAMMHMLQYEVHMGLIPSYSYAWILNNEDAYHELSIHLRMSPLAQLSNDELVFLLTKKWLWVLNLSAMAAVVNDGYKEQKAGSDISTIAKYLRDQNLLDFTTNPLQRLTKILTEELDAVDYLPTKAGAALVKITNRLSTPDYKQAQEALTRVLNRSKGACLVMVDAIELYNLKDNIAQAVITALIEATRRMYSTRATNHVLVKVAFPSEIYPHLSSLNQEKTEGKNMFILWQYRDLVSLLAKRYWQMVHKDDNPDAYVRLGDFHIAQDFLYQYLVLTEK